MVLVIIVACFCGLFVVGGVGFYRGFCCFLFVVGGVGYYRRVLLLVDVGWCW
jgi:hypothetical protein